MKKKGRLLADSAITTYFGRPAWHAYGNGNVKPAQGGLMYGDYMLTHNINPHSGDNKPKKVQIYTRAQKGHQVGHVQVQEIHIKDENNKLKKKKCKSVVMTAKRERNPSPPRPGKPKRDLTEKERRKELAEQMQRFAIMPDSFEKDKHRFDVVKP